jgi:hypothetical protein
MKLIKNQDDYVRLLNEAVKAYRDLDFDYRMVFIHQVALEDPVRLWLEEPSRDEPVVTGDEPTEDEPAEDEPGQ